MIRPIFNSIYKGVLSSIYGGNNEGGGGTSCDVYLFDSTEPDELVLGSAFTGNLKVMIAGLGTTGLHPDIIEGLQGTFTASADPVNEPVWNQFEIAAVAIAYIVDTTFSGRVAYAKDDVWYNMDMGAPIEPPVVIGGNVVQCTNPVGIAGTWYFGDGNQSTDVDPSHEYAVHGTYSVLFDSDTGVDDVSLEVAITALPLPYASFTSTPDNPESNTVTFHGMGGDTYSWIIDGVPYTGQNPTHTFSAIADDTYTVELVVTDSNGNTGFVAEQVFVQIANVPPVVNLSYDKNLLVVDFDSNAADPDGSDYNMTCEWDFGDGNTLSTGNGITTTQHTYPAPTIPLDPNGQEFTASVTVIDERGGQTYSEVTFKVFDYLAVGSELVPANLSTMDSDDEGLVSKFGVATVIDFDTYPSEMYYSGDISLSSSRMAVDISTMGLENGKRYMFASRIKAVSGTGQIRDWTCANISTVNLVVDGIYHDYEFAFECTDDTGELRISHKEVMYLDTLSIKEQL